MTRREELFASHYIIFNRIEQIKAKLAVHSRNFLSKTFFFFSFFKLNLTFYFRSVNIKNRFSELWETFLLLPRKWLIRVSSIFYYEKSLQGWKLPRGQGEGRENLLVTDLIFMSNKRTSQVSSNSCLVFVCRTRLFFSLFRPNEALPREQEKENLFLLFPGNPQIW